MDGRKGETPCAVLKTYTWSYSVCAARKVLGGGLLSDELTCESRQSALTQLLQPAGVLLPIYVAQCSYELLVGKGRLSLANLGV